MNQLATICEYNRTERRLAKNSYGHRYSWADMEHTYEGDRMALFTLQKNAEQDSQDHVNVLIEQGKIHAAKFLVIHQNLCQFVGPDTKKLSEQVWNPTWLDDYRRWTDSNAQQRHDVTDDGSCSSIWLTRLAMCVKKHAGVYELDTGKRMTNRREIIGQFWQHGFATRRGRPLSVAQIKDTGTRDELKELTDLADKYWQRGISKSTEITRRYIATYRYLNKYHAWPGSW